MIRAARNSVALRWWSSWSGSVEEAPLAHDALGVQRPALVEVRRRVDPPHLATRLRLAHRRGASGGPGRPRGPRSSGSSRRSCSTAATGSPPPRRRRARTGRRSGPSSESENAGGATYDATPSTGRWNTGDGTTAQVSPVGQRDEAGVDEELPRPLGPLGVGVEHRLLGGRVVRVVLAQDLDVVGVAGRVARRARAISASSRSNSALAALAQRAGVVGEDLALLEDPASSAPRPAATSRAPRSTNSLEVRRRTARGGWRPPRRRPAGARGRRSSSTSCHDEVAHVAGAARAAFRPRSTISGWASAGSRFAIPASTARPTCPSRATAASTRSALAGAAGGGTA